MLVLFDTPAGHALFKVLDTKKISAGSPDDIFGCFKDLDSTNGMCAVAAPPPPAARKRAAPDLTRGPCRAQGEAQGLPQV
jgi:hypothetical protein